MPFPTSLPIDPHLESLCAQVARQPVTLIQAPPGTGKTVHLPLALLKLGPVWILEPRRVAARLAAQFAAKEAQGIDKTPDAVGYHFRSENRTHAHTELTYLTEGMLLRLAQNDPNLARVKTVILDEFHERHLSTDTAWAYLRHLQATTRPDLRIVILSATPDVATLTAQIPNLAPQVIALNHYPLTLLYREDASIPAAVLEAHQLLTQTKNPGSILIFLAGKRDIELAREALRAVARELPLPVEILHGSLDAQEQARILATGREPRIILTTNLAESSITVDGVRAVIDGGYYRQAHAQPWSGIPELRTRRITRASATQRAGRAARQGAGIAIRLYSAADHQGFISFESPELLRSDLAATTLELLALGIPEPEKLTWLDPPPPGTWEVARTLLENLGFLQANQLTSLGEAARRIPSSPRIARLLLGAAQTRDPTSRARLEDLSVGLSAEQLPSGDCTQLRLPDTPALREERKRLLVTPLQSPSTTFYAALLSAWGDHIARLKSQDPRGAIYLSASGNELWIPLSSTGQSQAPPQWIVALSVLDSRNAPDAAQRPPQIRSWLPLEEDDLLEAPPRFWQDAVTFKWEVDRQTFVQLSQSKFGQILLSETRRFPEPCESLGALLVEKFLSLAHAHPETRAWLESTWVRLRLAGLIADGAGPWAGGLQALLKPLAVTWRSLKDAPAFDEKNAPDLAQSIAAHLAIELNDSQAAHRLTQLAPRTLSLPKRHAPILYSLTEAPRCESRLQDFLGIKETPRVGQPPVPITLVLLAPNYRPVQITQDLGSFWRSAYPQLRKELMRHYPRHAWPENPLKP